MPNEIELKLRIAKADIPRLRHHAVIRHHLMQKAITRRLVSTYYDTPNLQLFDKRVSLRVRRMSGAGSKQSRRQDTPWLACISGWNGKTSLPKANPTTPKSTTPA